MGGEYDDLLDHLTDRKRQPREAREARPQEVLDPTTAQGGSVFADSAERPPARPPPLPVLPLSATSFPEPPPIIPHPNPPMPAESPALVMPYVTAPPPSTPPLA